jgi:hypothetical protein
MSRAIRVPPARLFPVFVALLLATTAFASIAASTAAAAKPCWERVIDDWIDNGRIDAYFSPACLRASLRHVPEDIRAYSDFEEKIRQGIQAALRVRVLEGRTGDPASRAERSQVDRLRENESDAGAGNAEGPIERALGYRNEDASSIPLPLIILAALALVLMAAGAAGVAHRKLQARKARSSAS